MRSVREMTACDPRFAKHYDCRSPSGTDALSRVRADIRISCAESDVSPYDSRWK